MDIRFTIGRLLLRGLHYRLAFAALIVAFVAVSAGLLVFLFDPSFEDPGDAVWWSFLRLSDPGYLGDDEGVVSVTISTVVTVLGYVLYLGLLVAILTQWMNTLILRAGCGCTVGLRGDRAGYRAGGRSAALDKTVHHPAMTPSTGVPFYNWLSGTILKNQALKRRQRLLEGSEVLMTFAPLMVPSHCSFPRSFSVTR